MAYRNRMVSAVIVMVACVVLDGCATVKKLVPWGKADGDANAATPVEPRDDSETGAASFIQNTTPSDNRNTPSSSQSSSSDAPTESIDFSVPRVQRDQPAIADPPKSDSRITEGLAPDVQANSAPQAENAASNGSTGADQWGRSVQQAIHRRWIQPRGPKIPLDFSCDVMVTLTPFGGVDDVKVVRSCGDVALDASIETAVRDSSPLPTPKDPADFSETLLLTFTPR